VANRYAGGKPRPFLAARYAARKPKVRRAN
jgi:hypothetical protein